MASYKTSKPTIVKQWTPAKIRWGVAGVMVFFLACILAVVPGEVNKGIDRLNSATNLGVPRLPDHGFNLGLDLQGGADLIYEAKTDRVAPADRATAVEGVRDVIERRVRGVGVNEALVQTTKVGDQYRVIVDLPGVQDVNQAIKMIGETPILEFKEENHDAPRELTVEEAKQLKDYNAQAEKKAREALSAIKNGMNFAQAVTQYSEDAAGKLSGGDLSFITRETYPELFDWASAHHDGEVSGDLIKTASGFNIAKRLAERPGEKYVQAAHLIVCYQGAQGCQNSTSTKEQAKAKIDEIKKQITTQNFVEMVKKYSTEPGAADRGGDLGSFKKADMVKEFTDAVFAQAVGTISEPVETAFGYHLIYKKGETQSKEYQVARVYIKTKDKTDFAPPAGEWKTTGLSGKYLKRAEVTQDSRSGAVQVSLNFDDQGTKLFGDITGRNIGKTVAIFLDGQPISIPRVNEAITSGSAVISGGFTIGEARILAQRLNSGALPLAVELLSQKKVDATLGSDSLHRSFVAGIIGLLLVMAFMIGYYRLPGLLSVFSLAFYTVLNLAMFKVMGVTITLSGIAGFVLSIGMAVDANILVFERLKEELQAGKSLRGATEESFARAWPSIRDSHITALISCVFLIWFGSGFVQGFAIVLAIGTLINLFTAIIVTRVMMRFIFSYLGEKGNWLFLGHRSEAAQQAATKKSLNA